MKTGNTVLALVLAAATGSAIAAEEDLVKYRKNAMEVIGGHMGSIVAIVKGEVPYSDELAYHAQGLAAAAPKVIPTFETRAMSEKSEALPEIWDDWAAFEKAALRLEDTSTELAAAVGSGDRGRIGKALGDVGESCKGCHDDFTEEH